MQGVFSRLTAAVVILFFSFATHSLAAAGGGTSLRSLTITGTADLQGSLEPSTMKLDIDGDGKKEEQTLGGISRIATLIKQIKAEKPGTTAVVSTGDDLMNRFFHVYKGKAIFRLMSMAGYDTYALGNHEFDKGPEVLADALKEVTFESVCSDLQTAGTPLEGHCLPLLIRDYKGLKVGFFSLMTEDFPMVTSTGGVTMSGNNAEVAAAMVKRLRQQGAQLVVALTHVGHDKDLQIARAVPGIDIIFGGHSHDSRPELSRAGDTLVLNGGEKGPFLVRLDVTVDENGKIIQDQSQYQLIPVTGDIAPDAETDALLASYQKFLPEAVVLGRTEVDWDLGKEAVRSGESTVADLINDLMREKFHVQIVLNNAGAFRGKKIYPAGPITDLMLKEIDEFGNYAYALDMQGKYIKEILERSAASFGEGGLLQPSGLRYTIDLKKRPQEIAQDARGQWQVTTAGERVTEIRVFDGDGKWVPLDPEKAYSVLSNSFLVNQEGDGYFWFKRYGQKLNNTYSTFYSILAEFVGNEGVVNPGKPDGRLTVVE